MYHYIYILYVDSCRVINPQKMSNKSLITILGVDLTNLYIFLEVANVILVTSRKDAENNHHKHGIIVEVNPWDGK